MELEQIYFLSEIVATIAVVASLVYVGVQLRQNTKTVRVAAGQTHVDAYDRLISKLVDNEQTMKAWVNSASGIADLELEEQTQVLAFVGVMFRTFEGAYIQWKEGVLDDRFWEGMLRSMHDQYMYHGGIRAFWSLRRHWFSNEFADWYDLNVKSKYEEPSASNV